LAGTRPCMWLGGANSCMRVGVARAEGGPYLHVSGRGQGLNVTGRGHRVACDWLGRLSLACVWAWPIFACEWAWPGLGGASHSGWLLHLHWAQKAKPVPMGSGQFPGVGSH
jgi:hypothetical protein